ETPRFFTPAQYSVLQVFADTILPHDGDVPGALDVRVPWFIDKNLHYTKSGPRKAWTDWLRMLDEASAGGSFAALGAAARVKVLESIARNEEHPRTPVERLFVFAKKQVVDAWALSEDGQRRGLGYHGNIAVKEFSA